MKPKLPMHPDSFVNEPEALTPEISAALRKRWIYLLPAVFVTYSLAFLDRANFGFGAAAGLAATLHITEKQTSLLSGLFFLGYFAFQLPGAALARRFSVSSVVFVCLMAWGLLAALTGIIQQFWLLAVDRLLLGVAESLIFPVMLHLLTRWFTRAERSRANTFLILGNPITVVWMSALTGILIQRFGWQRTFVFEGLPSVLWAFVWLLIVRDQPSKARWITPEAAVILESRLSREELAIASIKALRAALFRGDVLLLSVQYFCWSLGVYGFVLWLPSMVQRGGSLSMSATGLFSALPYLVSIVLMLIAAQISDRTMKRKEVVWPFLVVAAMGMFGSYFFAEKSFLLAFVGLVIAGSCMYAPYGPFFALIAERVPRNVTAEVLAMVNSWGALGGFFGSYLVGILQAITGNSRAGFLLMSLAVLCSAILLLFLKPAANATQAAAH